MWEIKSLNVFVYVIMYLCVKAKWCCAMNFPKQNNISNKVLTQIARFTGPTWDPPGSWRPPTGPMWDPWTLQSGKLNFYKESRGTFRCIHVYKILIMQVCKKLRHGQVCLVFVIIFLQQIMDNSYRKLVICYSISDTRWSYIMETFCPLWVNGVNGVFPHKGAILNLGL